MNPDDNLSGTSAQSVDHIGIAVDRIEGALPLYQDLLGLDLAGIENVESEQVRTARLNAEGTSLELLEPLGDDGPIQKFLDRHGPGIHHICFEVTDVEAMIDTFRDAGYEPIYDACRTGAGDAKVNFLHPDDTCGVLFELRQKT